MKLDELLNQLLDIASKHTDPSAVEVQVKTPDYGSPLQRDDFPLPIQQVTYRSPNNTFKSPGNIARVEMEV